MNLFFFLLKTLNNLGRFVRRTIINHQYIHVPVLHLFKNVEKDRNDLGNILPFVVGRDDDKSFFHSLLPSTSNSASVMIFTSSAKVTFGSHPSCFLALLAS